MNPLENITVLHSTSAITGTGTCPDIKDMKRQTVKELIQSYFVQLTEGCGNADCVNPDCASCPDFAHKDADRNVLAVNALALSHRRATLCEGIPSKCAKLPSAPPPGENTADRAYCAGAGTSGGDGTRGNNGGTLMRLTVSSILSSSAPLYSIHEEQVMRLVDEGYSSGSWHLLIHTIGSVFSTPECLMQSFLRGSTHSRIDSRQAHLDPDKDVDDAEAVTVSGDGTLLSGGSSEFLPVARSTDADRDVEAVDIDAVRRSYSALVLIPGLPFERSLVNAFTSLFFDLQMDFKYTHLREKLPNVTNIFVITMECPLLHSPEYLEVVFPEFCRAATWMPVPLQANLVKAWASYGSRRLMEMLQMLQQLVTVRILNQESRWGHSLQLNHDDALCCACGVMRMVYYASLYGSDRDGVEVLREERQNHQSDLRNLSFEGALSPESKEQFDTREDSLGIELGVRALSVRSPLIGPEHFVNELLNEHIDICTDYSCYRSELDGKFSFMEHSFLLSTATKHTLMYFDNRFRMLRERRFALLQTILLDGPIMPYLRLHVRRDHVVDDALVNLEMAALENPADLKKQLFVEFDGEQGLDEGGVSKEFFQLIIEELFNPDIGMFSYNEETAMFWFNSTALETESQFTLIGIVLGLAIYNSCILNIQLPMVVYRKLLGKKGAFHDLNDVDPVLSSSFQQMLDYDSDDFEDVFMQTFCISSRDIFGTVTDHELKDGGGVIPVTQQNKREFVDLYSNFILNKSVQAQFSAFKRGFLMVTNESPLSYLFRPEEVEMLVCGSKEYDFIAMEKMTEYDGGFSKDSPTIRNFWSVVHQFSDDERKRLLQFATGSDRVPVGGLAKLKFVIACNGPDSDRLPMSHTCFNVLLLPDYTTKEKLRERLLKAVTYAKGFGML